MKVMPMIQIRSYSALIGIETESGKQSIRQPRATMRMESSRPELQIRQPHGEIVIDQSRAWDALGKASNLEVMSRIYSQSWQIALQGIGRIVENGDQLAAIHKKTNAIADIAMQHTVNFGEYDFAGPAAYDNVDISYTPHKPQFTAKNAVVHVNARANPVEYEYQMGGVDIYMRRYPSIEITPPNLDIRV